MKFSTLDKNLQEQSANSLDLISFDQIKENPTENYPSFIVRGNYIKTITRIPGVDFFNLTPKEQEQKVNLWRMFLADLKTPVQIMVTSHELDINKYLDEAISQVKNSPYLNEQIKKNIINGLPLTLKYIQEDGESTKFKKEYYLITSCRINFSSEYIQEDTVNETDNSPYKLGQSKNYNERQWSLFAENFNSYYRDILGSISGILDEGKFLEPLREESEIIGLFAELNNQIPKKKFTELQKYL